MYVFLNGFFEFQQGGNDLGKKDIATKELFENPENFADFFNACIFEGEKHINPCDLYDENTEVSSFIDLGDEVVIDLERRRDVIMKHDKNNTYVILCVENQSKVDKEIPLKVLSYDNTTYLKQKRKHDYKIDSIKQKISLLEKLLSEGHEVNDELMKMKESLSYAREEKYNPVVTVVFYHGERNWTGPLNLKDMCDIPDYIKDYVNDWVVPVVCIKDIDTSKFESKEMLTVIGTVQRIYDNKEDEMKKLQYLDISRHTAIILCKMANLPGLLKTSESQKEESFSMSQAYLDFVANCEAHGENRGIEIGQARGIEIGQARGIEIGQARGIEIGQARGIEIGQARGIGIEKEKEMKMIKSLMEKFQMNAKNAMDTLDIPIADQQEFLLMLAQ